MKDNDLSDCMNNNVEIVNKKRINIKRIITVACLLAYDALVVVLSSFLALVFRYEFNFAEIPQGYVDNVKWFLPFQIVLTILIFFLFRMYHSLWLYAGVTEMQNIVFACAISAVVSYVGLHVTHHVVPRSYYVTFPLVLLCFILMSRFFYRFLQELERRLSNSKNAISVMIIGGGDAGNVIIKEIISSRYSTMRVRCVIDDNPNKWGRYVQGIRIYGGRDQILEASKKFGIDEIIIAIPSAPKHVIRDLVNICKETDCKLRTLPGMYQLVNGEVDLRLGMLMLKISWEEIRLRSIWILSWDMCKEKRFWLRAVVVQLAQKSADRLLCIIRSSLLSLISMRTAPTRFSRSLRINSQD